MKINKKKVKKGMTLVEVIISVTLLSILIIPLSTLVLSGFRNSKEGENKQKAVYVGQKVLEELKAYDKINLKENTIASPSYKYFELLNGDEVKQVTADSYKSSFQRSIYGLPSEAPRANEPVFNVELTISKNTKFDYDNVNSIDYSKAGYKLKLVKKDGVNKLIDENNPLKEIIVKDDLVIEVKVDKNLEIYNVNDSSNKLVIPIISGAKNILFINHDETFDRDTENIEVINHLSTSVDFNLVTNSTTNVDNITGNKRMVNVFSTKGSIMFTEIDQAKEATIADMYNYDVVVRDKKDNILFEGASSSNIIIK
ncbi:prepilin-type N-terminal cleavage/methylation domain-containing protein [Clostridium tertium]|uniref:Prepilin-type N-terminal cleavage/methylation domain-containing protein n=1 Tax=Clostridium tertium TaxID=1559 RepID=A0A6N3GWM6_9CLOT